MVVCVVTHLTAAQVTNPWANCLKCIAAHRIYKNDMNICKHLSVKNATSRPVYTFKALAFFLSDLTSILFHVQFNEFDIISEIML